MRLTILICFLTLAPHIFGQTNPPKELTALKESFFKARLAAVAPLEKKYRDSLMVMKDRFTRSGDLQSALAVEAELKEFQVSQDSAKPLQIEGDPSMKEFHVPRIGKVFLLMKDMDRTQAETFALERQLGLVSPSSVTEMVALLTFVKEKLPPGRYGTGLSLSASRQVLSAGAEISPTSQAEKRILTEVVGEPQKAENTWLCVLYDDGRTWYFPKSERGLGGTEGQMGMIFTVKAPPK